VRSLLLIVHPNWFVVCPFASGTCNMFRAHVHTYIIHECSIQITFRYVSIDRKILSIPVISRVLFNILSCHLERSTRILARGVAQLSAAIKPEWLCKEL
jgi:hypothetical protein